MLLSSVLIIFLVAANSFVNAKSAYGKRMECSGDKKLIQIIACSLTPIRKNVAVINFRAKVTRPISPDLLRMKQFIKEDGVYTIMKNSLGNVTYKFCNAVEGNVKHRVRSFVLKFLATMAPSAVHSCPYSGLLEVKNVTLNFNGVPLIGEASENVLNITITKGKSVFLQISAYFGFTLK